MGIRILMRFIRMMRIVKMGIVRMVAILVRILIWMGCMVLNPSSSFTMIYIICIKITVAQKTAPIFAYYIKTHVLLNADII